MRRFGIFAMQTAPRPVCPRGNIYLCIKKQVRLRGAGVAPLASRAGSPSKVVASLPAPEAAHPSCARRTPPVHRADTEFAGQRAQLLRRSAPSQSPSEQRTPHFTLAITNPDMTLSHKVLLLGCSQFTGTLYAISGSSPPHSQPSIQRSTCGPFQSPGSLVDRQTRDVPIDTSITPRNNENVFCAATPPRKSRVG